MKYLLNMDVLIFSLIQLRFNQINYIIIFRIYYLILFYISHPLAINNPLNTPNIKPFIISIIQFSVSPPSSILLTITFATDLSLFLSLSLNLSTSSLMSCFAPWSLTNQCVTLHIQLLSEAFLFPRIELASELDGPSLLPSLFSFLLSHTQPPNLRYAILRSLFSHFSLYFLLPCLQLRPLAIQTQHTDLIEKINK